MTEISVKTIMSTTVFTSNFIFGTKESSTRLYLGTHNHKSGCLWHSSSISSHTVFPGERLNLFHENSLLTACPWLVLMLFCLHSRRWPLTNWRTMKVHLKTFLSWKWRALMLKYLWVFVSRMFAFQIISSVKNMISLQTLFTSEKGFTSCHVKNRHFWSSSKIRLALCRKICVLSNKAMSLPAPH